MADSLRQLARWRVPLGFVAAIVAFALAQPTWRMLAIGFGIALVGEVIRIWAAGHLEKGKEVTRSGPYQWVRHPLYVGSSVIALGVAVAAQSAGVALVALVYMGSTIAAAVRTEERDLRAAFGAAYDHDATDGPASRRSFSPARAVRNGEYRAVIGLLAGFALLALRIKRPL